MAIPVMGVLPAAKKVRAVNSERVSFMTRRQAMLNGSQMRRVLSCPMLSTL